MTVVDQLASRQVGDRDKWRTRSRELASWSMAHLVNRRDAFGQYVNGSALTAKSRLDVATIAKHFEGDPIIGLHVIASDGRCRWLCWDFDRHDGDPEHFVERNMKQAVELVGKLQRLGMFPLLEDSNGRGGLHVWLLLSEPRNAWDVRSWAASVLADAAVEIFPKQDRIDDGGFGNFMRLPGRHPRNGHWSRFRVGDDWYHGDDAIELLLSWDASDADRIPHTEEPETPTKMGAVTDAPTQMVDLCRRAIEAITVPNNEHDGSKRLFGYSCRVVEHGLSDRQGLEVIRVVIKSKPFPTTYDTQEIVQRIRDAERKVIRGSISVGTIPPGRFKSTDLGNAERFVHLHGDSVRFCPQWGCFLVWDGTRWMRDDVLEVHRFAKDTVRAIYGEAAATDHDDIRKAVVIHARRSEARGAITAMIELAKGERLITVSAEHLDANPWLLNVANGTIDLRTGELREHRRDDLITKLAPVDYLPDATHPVWQEFLLQIFGQDLGLVGYVRRWFGHCLTGSVNEQIMPVLYGTGANGKTTMLDAILQVMGDYGDHAPPELLIQRHGHDEHPTELADLMGKRLIVASESEKGRRLRVQLMKRITGETTLKARFMRMDYFAFSRTFKTVLVTNNKPKVDEDSEATWRRLKLVPFSVTIPKNEQDKRLPNKLKAEASGILRWLVEGCLEWQRDGLIEPAMVLSATENYREESDPLQDFIDDCCNLSPGNWASTSALRQEYETWCKDRGDRPLRGNSFSDGLRKHGCTPQRSDRTRGWLGIGLLSGDQEAILCHR